MNNEEKKKKIREWQISEFVHPLNCIGKDGCGSAMRPIEVEGEIVLECLGCKKIQKYIPGIVLKTNIEELNKSMKKLVKGMRL